MIGIGTTATRSEGPVELLLACHARIRSFTELAARLASDERAPEAEVAEAARRVHRYHAVALPLHQQDEELSIAPRLERLAPPAVLEALAAMKRQHVVLDEVLAGLLPRWERLAAEPGLRGELSPAMGRDVARMQVLWAEHLGPEEAVIFPALRSLPDLAEIGREMRGRRSGP